ncbi:MAG: amino acid permease [Terriglobales bacterium]
MKLRVLLLGLAVLCGAGSAAQQLSTSVLNGDVTDPLGALISGAQVTAEHRATGIRRTTITSNAGLFVLMGPAAFIANRRATSETRAGGELRRQLGLGAATAAVAGEAIAVGIFLTPAGMAKMLGSPLLLFGVWVAMGVIAASGAVCYGELAARFPQAGGAYVYLRECFGHRAAFLYGWMSLFVMDPGVTAALAIGLTSYLAYIVPLTPMATKLIGIAVVCALAAVNIVNARAAAMLLQVTTWLKVAILVLLPAWAIAFRVGNWSNFVPLAERYPGSPPIVAALAGGIVAAFFSFGGWWDASKLAGEVRDPARTLPRAFILGVSAVTLVYVTVSAAFLYAVPLERVTSDQTFVAQAGEVMFDRFGAEVLAATVVLCVLGSLAALIMAAPRVYFAMGQDGAFVPAVGRLNRRFGTPERAIVIQAVFASVLILLGRFETVIAYFMFPTLIFVGLTVAAIFVLGRKRGQRRRHLAATLFVTLIGVVLVLVAIRNPAQAALGTAIVALGIPVWTLLKRVRARRVPLSCTGARAWPSPEDNPSAECQRRLPHD